MGLVQGQVILCNRNSCWLLDVLSINIFVNRQDEMKIQANSSLLDCVHVVSDACAHMCVRITSAVD